jgi:hypothetical protein
MLIDDIAARTNWIVGGTVCVENTRKRIQVGQLLARPREQAVATRTPEDIVGLAGGVASVAKYECCSNWK